MRARRYRCAQGSLTLFAAGSCFRRFAGAAALLALAGAAVAEPPAKGKGGQRRGGFADPSVIIAAELAFDRLAVEKGQWTALVDIVAKDAVLFRPEPVFAEHWLKGQRNPTAPMRWQTREVYMACDGSVAISSGTWIRSGGDGRGWFTNIWRRDKKGYRLILSDDGPLSAPEAARDEDELEAMTARIATCAKRGGSAGPVEPVAVAPLLDPAQPLPQSREDRAEDGSLRWRWTAMSGGAHRLEAWMATDSGEAPISIGHGGPAAR